ncbi:MAG: hypothetical protein ABR587_09060 [Candidatus Binatia bacterium]
MNRSLRRRFSAALVFPAAFLFSLSFAIAADSPAGHAAKSEGKPDGKAVSTAGKSSLAPAGDLNTNTLRHGSRAKAADGSLLVWDNVTKVFASPDRKDTYWVDDQFFQHEKGLWMTSPALAGPWELVPISRVPEVARGRHAPLRVATRARLPWGREAVYEPKLKVYKVAGLKGVFLFDATFFRYENGVWLESSRDEGPWTVTSGKLLPQVLRRAVPAPVAGQKATLPSGETLVSEGEAGIFAVDGRPDTVFFEGAFYERRGNDWFTSTKSATGYVDVPVTKVPGPVRTKYHRPGDPKVKPAREQQPAAKTSSKAQPAGSKSKGD